MQNARPVWQYLEKYLLGQLLWLRVHLNISSEQLANCAYAHTFVLKKTHLNLYI